MSAASSVSAAPVGGAGYSGKHNGPSSALDIGSELLNWRPDDPLARLGKVVGTLGPATMTAEMIEKLIQSGLDIFRLNSSHRRLTPSPHISPHLPVSPRISPYLPAPSPLRPSPHSGTSPPRPQARRRLRADRANHPRRRS